MTRLPQGIVKKTLSNPYDILMVNSKSNFHRSPAISMLLHGALKAVMIVSVWTFFSQCDNWERLSERM